MEVTSQLHGQRKTPDRGGSQVALRKWSSKLRRLKELGSVGQSSGKERVLGCWGSRTQVWSACRLHVCRETLHKAGQKTIPELKAERVLALTQLEGIGKL